MSDLSHIVEQLRPLAVPVDSLNFDPENARLHPPENVAVTRGSMVKFGQYLPLVVQRAGMIVRVGNNRLGIAKELGWTHVAAVITDHPDEVARALALVDNRSAELATWDVKALRKLLDAPVSMSPDLLSVTGFDEAARNRLFKVSVSSGGAANLTPEIQAMFAEADQFLLDEWAAFIASRQRAAGILHTELSRGVAMREFIQAKYLGGYYRRTNMLAWIPDAFFAGPKSPGTWLASGKAQRLSAFQFRLEHHGAKFIPAFTSGFPLQGSKLAADFPAHLASSLIDEFCPAGGRVLDPCHGWGGRVIGFLLCQKAAEYVGADPSPVAAKGVNEIVQHLAPFAEPNKKTTIHNSPFETQEFAGLFDFALTSPPYFDVEFYHGEKQSASQFDKFEAWRDGWYLPMIKRVISLLKPGGVFALQVGSQSYPLLESARAAASDGSFQVVEVRSAGMPNHFHETEAEEGEVVAILRKPQ